MTATRYQGVIGSFAVPNALRGAQTAEAASNRAIVALRKTLHAS